MGLKKSEIKIEKLSHFECFYCKKWWTVGDASPKKTGFVLGVAKKTNLNNPHGKPLGFPWGRSIILGWSR